MRKLFTEARGKALREAAQTKIFGKAMGLVVRKSTVPEAYEGKVDLKPPFTVYTVRTPAPQDAALGAVLKKGRDWYFARARRTVTKARGPMPALKALVMRHIMAVMKTEQDMGDATLEKALQGLGCPILRRLAHEWGIVDEWGRL